VIRSLLDSVDDITSAECASTTEDDVREQAFPQVEIDAIDRVYDNLVNASIFLADKFWVEENFRGSESF
jgi:hypothetical protein